MIEVPSGIIYQNDSMMPSEEYRFGCCWRCLVASAEIVEGSAFPRAALITQWYVSKRQKWVGTSGWVADVNAVLRYAVAHIPRAVGWKIEYIAATDPSSPNFAGLPEDFTPFLILREETEGLKTHFTLRNNDLTLLFNPFPGYQVRGTLSYGYLGIRPS